MDVVLSDYQFYSGGYEVKATMDIEWYSPC